MPFKSEAQRRWMHANKPETAKQWEAETSNDTKLPARAKKNKKTKSKTKKSSLPPGGYHQ